MTQTLSGTAASAAIEGTGWRYLLGAIVVVFTVDSCEHAVQVADAAVIACGSYADEHLRLDLRPDRVEIGLQTHELGHVTDIDVTLSRRITEALTALGISGSGPWLNDGRRSVQMLEIAIDAMNIPAIRPFWKAVMGYTDEPGRNGPGNGLVDPVQQGPTIWFQQMDEPRPQRNRIHFDVTVPHDVAQIRLRAALDAGGVLVSELEANSFWLLADMEGNEVCICTWQDRD